MSTKIITKVGSIHDYTIHPDVGDTVTFTRGSRNITSLPIPYVRIDAYESNGGPLVITWLTPEHYEQARKFLCAGYDDHREYELPQAWYGERFRRPNDDHLIPVSMIPLELRFPVLNSNQIN